MNEVDWGRYNLPAIWNLISDVDVCTGSDRVLAWDGLAAEMRDQHKRLLAAADSLAAVWPPEKNESAKFFLQQVNGLADSMGETLQRAEDTKAGLQGVIGAFSTAQEKVRELAAGREAVGSDWMPRFVDHAEDKYDQHAQAAMREAESAIEDHGSQIQAPALFQMGIDIDESGHHLNDGGGRSDGSSSSGGSGRPTLRATPVPVAVHSHPVGASPDSRTAFRNVGSGSIGPATSESSSGPVLSGVTPVVPGRDGLPGPTIGTGASPGVGLPASGPVGGAVPLPPGILPIGGDGFADDVSDGVGADGRRPVSVRRAMPSGAVIGEGAERGVEPNGGSTMGMMPMGGAGGGGRQNPRGTGHGQADQRWKTAQGVPPVIGPGTTNIQHDPGPGVIGLDR